MVIQDDTLPVNFIVPGDLTDSILSALIQASDIATLLKNPSVSNAIALALIAAQNASPFDAATNAQILTALTAVQNAQSAINAAIAGIETILF